ncbi:MAG: PQQ-binding-like beta-propeller repeat protein [Candidatus Polarisedimenticolia bacterium]
MTPTRRLRVLSGFALALSLTFAFASTVSADDWSQWRGQNRDGRSAETGLLGSWPEGGPRRLWSAPGFGAGYSSLAVTGGRIFTLGDLGDGQYVIAAKEADGAILWKTKLGPVHEDQYPGPRSTPTLAGGKLYALGTSGILVCLNPEDGKEIWRRDLKADFSGDRPHWMYSESPLVDAGRVVVTPGGSDALMVALDSATGKETWRARGGVPGDKGKDGPGYASSVISTAGGVRQYVQLVGRGVVGVDAQSGRLLWSYNKVANDVANIPTPIVNGDSVFVSTGYQTGAALLQLAGGGDGVKASEKYFLPSNVFQNHHGNMVLDKGVIYAGHGHNRGNPIAVEMESGKVLWGPAQNAGKGSAAVAWADGRLYLRYQNGLMVLAEANPTAYQERGSFTIPEVKRESWSHPVIANGVLLLREQDQIHAYGLKDK